VIGLLNYMGKENGPRPRDEGLQVIAASLILGIASIVIVDNVQTPQADLSGVMSQSVDFQDPQELRRNRKSRGFKGNQILWEQSVIRFRNR